MNKKMIAERLSVSNTVVAAMLFFSNAPVAKAALSCNIPIAGVELCMQEGEIDSLVNKYEGKITEIFQKQTEASGSVKSPNEDTYQSEWNTFLHTHYQ